MDQPFIGTIWLFAGNFAPSGWAFCNGQTLPIQQYQALYTILGTVYGGDGQTTFGLPDLRGRVPIGAGPLQGNGTNYVQGQKIGAETVTLQSSQMPVHTHLVEVSTTVADSPQANGNFLAANATYGPDSVDVYTLNGAPTPGSNLNPATLTAAGGSTPHENRQPSLVMNYIIATQGYFPARN
jgi:microcystin-dependent protein